MRLFRCITFVSLLIGGGCSQEDASDVFYPFKNHSWSRFNILSFEIPVKQTDRPYQVIFYIRHNKDFPFDFLDFNMVMNTPSGEERINEYHLETKDKKGSFLGKCKGEVCEISMELKKELYISTEGNLIIELENLNPRLETPGLLGVGIRLVER